MAGANDKLAEELIAKVRSGELSAKEARDTIREIDPRPTKVNPKGVQVDGYLADIDQADIDFRKQVKSAAATAVAGGPADKILQTDAGKKAVQEAAVKRAEISGSSNPAQAGQSALDRLIGSVSGGSTSPDWFASALGVEVSAAQKAQIIDRWNKENPDDLIASDADFNAKLSVPSPYAKRMVQDAVWGTKPDQSWSIRVGPGDSGLLKVQDSQMKAVMKLYGYNEDTLTALLRDGLDLGVSKLPVAAQHEDHGGSYIPKPDLGNVSWQPLMAIARKTGMSNDSLVAPTIDVAGTARFFDGKGPAKFSPDYYAASQRYKLGLDKYGDPLLAYLSTFDESLASRLVVADGNVSAEDQTAMGQLLLDGFGQASGGDAQGAADVLMQLGQFTSNSALKKALGKQAVGPKGPVVQLPDPEKIRQATQEVWQSLMLGDPDEATYNSIITAINSNVAQNTNAAYAGGTTVTDLDPMAKIKAEAQQTSIYHELFGNKPQGMSDAEYVGMQKQGVASMLGNETDPNLVRAGMRSGNYQGAVGSTLGSSQAWQNSTFMDRLARAATAANEVT